MAPASIPPLHTLSHLRNAHCFRHLRIVQVGVLFAVAHDRNPREEQPIVPPDPSRPERDRRVTADRRALAHDNGRGEEHSRSERETIATLRSEIAALQEENALLRRAAIAFGALAERLNARLRSGSR